MKKFLVVVVVSIMAPFFSYGQDTSYMYCELLGTGKLFSNKVTVQIDFGQATKFFDSDQRLKGDDGKPIKFNSMVDAMNFMGNDGWEFVQAYVITIGQQNVYHWLLKKDISKLSAEEKENLKSSMTDAISGKVD